MSRTRARPAAGDPLSAVPPERETVVLLHGLGRTTRSFAGLARWLRGRGYDALNLGYPSRRDPVDELAARLRERMGARLGGAAGPVHFVTHSLGGIVLRAMLAAEPLTGLGRVVMLCPPNRGSEVADLVKGVPLARLLLGPTLAELGTGRDDAPSRLPPPAYEVGVIAGDRAAIPFFRAALPGPHDGLVTVERTRLAGMADFLVVRRAHTFIMHAPEVRRQIVHFLREGRFRH